MRPRTPRHRILLLTLLTMVGLLGAASPAWASPAGHQPSGAPGGGTYLALGDSVPFGYRGNEAPASYADPTNFTGYPEIVAADRGLTLLNASCPGETTDSFIDVTAQSNGCENGLTASVGYRTAFPLHVTYDSPVQSQLDYAVATLARTPDVRLVTIQLGANDAFLCQQTTPDQCTSSAEVRGIAEHVRANLDHILATLRTEGGYTGQIIAVTYYALDYATPAAGNTLVLNSGILRAALVNRAYVASGFLAFVPAALRAGGNSTTAGLVLPNDVHPSATGQQLLAGAVERWIRRH